MTNPVRSISLKGLLGVVRSIHPWLLLRIVESRGRFQKRRAGKVVVGREVQGLKHAIFAGKNSVGSGAIFAGQVKVGYGTTIGSNNYLVGPIEIGNYCQLGAAVGIYGRDHRVNHVTMYFNQNLFEGRLERHSIVSEVRIGHDVWIGHGAVILKGVEIGNGAVIGAGAIVTKNVPEYAIAVGNPARVLRKRFDDEVIALLRKTQWWLKSADELAPFEEVFHLDLNANRDKALALLIEMIANFQKSGDTGAGAAEKP
jgi:virginiamycin A acetyltransferase